MLRFPLQPSDLSLIRFAVSETWETVVSVRALRAGRRASHHQPWLQLMQTKLDADLITPLLALIPATGYLPDALTPMVRDQESFAESLADLSATPADEWDRQLSHMDPDPTWDPIRAALHGARGRDQIVETLRAYHQVAIAPFWPRLRALDQADIDYRSKEMAVGGVQRVFANLHPKVSLGPAGVEVRGYRSAQAPSGHGLLLVPCAFAWPNVLCLTADHYLATLTYAPRGIGNLWTMPDSDSLGSLERLIGTTRARILRQLDIAVSTSAVAAAMEVSKSTASEHLQVLAGTGLVASARVGREVLYRRTRIGDALLQQR